MLVHSREHDVEHEEDDEQKEGGEVDLIGGVGSLRRPRHVRIRLSRQQHKQRQQRVRPVAEAVEDEVDAAERAVTLAVGARVLEQACARPYRGAVVHVLVVVEQMQADDRVEKHDARQQRQHRHDAKR